jgi:hypothetical protein
MIFKRTYLAVEDTRNVESTRKTNNDASELLLRDDDCESTSRNRGNNEWLTHAQPVKVISFDAVLYLRAF